MCAIHGVANYNRLQFNFNEAVNFALPDWLPFGLDCVKRYQEHRKLPVFSHDELLITITQQNHSIQTALWCVRLVDSRSRKRQLNATLLGSITAFRR